MNIYRESTVVCKPLHRVYSNNSNVIVKIWEELATLFCESVESGRSINTSDNLYCLIIWLHSVPFLSRLSSLRAIILLLLVSPESKTLRCSVYFY